MDGSDDDKAKVTRSCARPAGQTPKADSPQELAVSFVCSVTVFSASNHDWIARNGMYSPNSALHCLLPQVL